MLRFLKQYGLTLIVVAAIAYLSLAPHMPSGLPKIQWFAHQDKLVHALMYVGLGGALALNMRRAGHSWRLIAIWAITLPCLYGGVIELLQEAYFPPRTGEWLDWAADIAGTLVGVGAVRLMTKPSQSIQ